MRRRTERTRRGARALVGRVRWITVDLSLLSLSCILLLLSSAAIIAHVHIITVVVCCYYRSRACYYCYHLLLLSLSCILLLLSSAAIIALLHTNSPVDCFDSPARPMSDGDAGLLVRQGNNGILG